MVGIRFGRGSVCSFSRTVCSFYSSAFAKTENSLSLAIATVIVWFQICDVFVASLYLFLVPKIPMTLLWLFLEVLDSST